MDVEQADRVLATLEVASPEALRTFAAGLSLAGGPVGLFGTPVSCLADVVEDPALDGWLANLSLRCAVRRAARHPELVEQLEGAEEPFWRLLRQALVDEPAP